MSSSSHKDQIIFSSQAFLQLDNFIRLLGELSRVVENMDPRRISDFVGNSFGHFDGQINRDGRPF